MFVRLHKVIYTYIYIVKIDDILRHWIFVENEGYSGFNEDCVSSVRNE